MDVIYIDFAKFYDKIDLGILTFKLKEMGFDGKSYDEIKTQFAHQIFP